MSNGKNITCGNCSNYSSSGICILLGKSKLISRPRSCDNYVKSNKPIRLSQSAEDILPQAKVHRFDVWFEEDGS